MRHSTRQPDRPTPIAIVGMAVRLPGATDLDALWEMIERGDQRIVGLPRERWDPEFDAADLPPEVNPRCCDRGCILPELELDWRQLRMPPAQARKLHRMELAALSCMVDALLAAGFEASGQPHARVRVFIASNSLGPDPRVDHGRRIRRFELHEPVRRALHEVAGEDAAALEQAVVEGFERSAPPIDPDSMMTSASIIAGRLSNIFNLQGGHVAIDADGASSLAALHEAVKSLRLGECDHALVCGVSSLLGAPALLAAAHSGLLGMGVPRPFMPDAAGTVLGEGAAAVLLARPEAVGAQRVHAWVEGLASAPVGNGSTYEAVARASMDALAEAGVEPSELRFVESRAAGVPEHDQAEAEGLAHGYETHTRSEPLAVGSTASSCGELGAAGGLVGVVMAAMCLQRGMWLGQLRDRAPELGPGLVVSSGRTELAAGERVGISDVAVELLAYHAVLAESRAHPPVKRPPRWPARHPRAIAIVGMSVHVPGAASVDELWLNTLAQIDAIGDMPATRWDAELLVGSDPSVAAVLRTRLAATIPTPTLDDHPRWAALEHERGELDPAVVLALLTSSNLIRDIRPSLERIDARRIGVVFGQLPLRAREIESEKRSLFSAQLALTAQILRARGCPSETITAVLAAARREFETDARLGARPLGPEVHDYESGIACAQRVARVFELHGPVLSVDAACASSLAAVHMASVSLLLGETDLVLAGGVAYNLLPEYYIALSVLGALSTRGAPPFTTGADGFVPGEGAGVVALRRLEDAERDGDQIHAVIEGIGFCSDGRGTSIFAPNPSGEQRAISRALAAAGLNPADVDYVEAHGTGTRLGDDTELRSIIETYGRREGARPLNLSSVKSQVGHLSSAAGIVGLIRAALAIRERVLPAGCGDGDPIPRFVGSHIGLADYSRPWISRGGRHAGVSSFGLGGANYHLILGEREGGGPQRTELELPLPPPVREQEAERFSVELVPLARPVRPPSYPLAGRRFLVLSDASGFVYQAIARALEARGASCEQIAVEEFEPEELARQSERVFRGAEPYAGIIDLRSFAAPLHDTEYFLSELEGFARRTFALLRPAYEQLERGGCYVAITAMGGDLGLMGSETGSLFGAYLLGLSKGIKQELPQAQVKTIDFDRAVDPDELAEFALAELEDGNDRMEVGWAGQRFVTNLEQRNFGSHDPVIDRLAPGDVFVFSGGSRGVVFECALALASLGVRVVVTGRTELPPTGAKWLGYDDSTFEAWRRQLLHERRAQDPRLTPVAFAREFAVYKRQRELDRNLARARSLSLTVAYETCDVMDRDSVEATLARVRKQYGRIDGIGHGAMLEWSRSLPSKTDDIVRKTTMVKVAGLLYLLEATREDRLKLFVAFGSGAGRFGNRGQTDYSAANSLMATTLRAKARELSGRTHCVTIDWTAWREVGAAADDADLAERVRETGVTSISVEEGIWHFVDEMFRGDAHEIVIFSEDMQWKWPFLGSQSEGVGERRRFTDGRGGPLVPGEWPLIDRVGVGAGPGPGIGIGPGLGPGPGPGLGLGVEAAQGKQSAMVFHRQLSIHDDYFLAEHRLNDAPILPATFGCELLAEGAAIVSPGWYVESIENYEISAPAKLGNEGVLNLRGDVSVVDETEDVRVLEVSTRSDLVLRGHTLQSNRLHHRAHVILRREPPGPLLTDLTPPVDGGGLLHARSVFAHASDPVLLGPQFLRAQWILASEDGVIGTCRAPRERAIMVRSSMPQFQVDPMVLDTAFQIAANWDGLINRWVSVPMGVAKVRCGARRRRHREVTRVRAQVERVADPDVYYRLVIFGDDDEPLLAVDGIWMRRVSRIARSQLGLPDEPSLAEERLRGVS